MQANFRSKPNYAEGQIKVLLLDLSNKNHTVKMRAVKRFHDYITAYRPEIYDDDIDLLYIGGDVDRKKLPGLLYYTSIMSSHHAGQLKRIASPVLALLRKLLTLSADEYTEENIFLSRFVVLTLPDILRINFEKIILLDRAKIMTCSSHENMDAASDILEIMTILMRDHRSPEGFREPIEFGTLINENDEVKEILSQWLAQKAADQVALNVEIYKEREQEKIKKAVENRPKIWGEVIFRPVPLQEGEDGVEEAVTDDSTEYKPITDPLGLSPIDLKVAQKLHARSCRLMQSLNGDFLNPLAKLELMRKLSAKKDGAGSDGGDTDEDERQADDKNTNEEDEEDKQTPSLVPTQRNFDTELFLTQIHGNITLTQLEDGLGNLNFLIDHQSSQRESLVREHFGLFVNCAETLEWLKRRRREDDSGGESEDSGDGDGDTVVSDNNEPTDHPAAEVLISESHIPRIATETKMAKAIQALETSKTYLHQAQSLSHSTLGPILARMELSRRIKGADQILRRIAATLEFPMKMRRALDRGDFEDVIAIYQKVLAIPLKSKLRIRTSIKDSANLVIQDLKNICMSKLTATELPSLAVVERHGAIVAAIESSTGCQTQTSNDALKQAFVKQLANFVSCISLSETKYHNECRLALKQAAELKSIYTTASGRSVSPTAGGVSPTMRKQLVDTRVSSRSDAIGSTTNLDNPNRENKTIAAVATAKSAVKGKTSGNVLARDESTLGQRNIVNLLDDEELLYIENNCGAGAGIARVSGLKRSESQTRSPFKSIDSFVHTGD